jgi:WD40 repeat protein
MQDSLSESSILTNSGTLQGHKDSVNALDFGGSGDTLASASDDSARMWDLDRSKAVRCFLPAAAVSAKC